MISTLMFKSATVLPALTLASKVVNAKNTMPILADFRIEVQSDTSIIVTASDGDFWLTIKTEVISADSGLIFCVDAKSFLQVVSNLNDKTLQIEADPERQMLNIKYDKGHIKMPFQRATEYPHPKVDFGESSKSGEIPAQILSSAINKTIVAVGSDEIRLVMTGIHFDFLDDCMVSVATDAKRLVKVKYDNVICDGKGFTLPTKPASLLASLLQRYAVAETTESVSFMYTDTHVSFRCNDFIIISRLIEGKYPNYEMVIPKQSNYRAVINKEMFVNALRHVLPMGNAMSQLVALRFGTLITTGVDIIAQDLEYNKSAQERVDCAYEGDDITIGFNGAVLLQMVQNVSGDEIVIELTDPKRCGVITDNLDEGRGETYNSIIMPMMVNEC